MEIVLKLSWGSEKWCHILRKKFDNRKVPVNFRKSNGGSKHAVRNLWILMGFLSRVSKVL